MAAQHLVRARDLVFDEDLVRAGDLAPNVRLAADD